MSDPLTAIPALVPSGGPIAITGPLSIPELLDRTFRALRARFGVLTLSAAMVMVPLAILTVLLSGRFLTGYFELIELSMSEPTSDLAAEEFLGEFAGYFGAILLLSLLYMLSSTLVSLMSIHHIQRFLHGEQSTVGEGWRIALRRLLPMLWMQILQFLIIAAVTIVVTIAIGIVVFLAAIALGGAAAALENEAASFVMMFGLIIAIIVGYILLLILILAPSIVFMGRWVAAAPSLVIEDRKPIDALRRSWNLTKGRMWRGIIFVVLLSILSTVVIGLPVGMAQWIAMLAMPSQLVMIGIISTLASYILNLFYQPFYATGTVLFYYDLRVRTEAYDVALRVAALEAELAPDLPPA
jgi:hypothetical protein